MSAGNAKGPGRPRIPAWQSLVAQPAGVEDLADAKIIDIGLLEPNPYQPRRTFDEGALDELAASIRADGVLQPLSVRAHPTQRGRYQIVAGERRWRAAQRAEQTSVPAVVREISDDAMERQALMENIQRSDLDPLDEAHAYQRLMERFTLSLRDLAASVHKSHEYVAQRLRLIEDPRIEASVRAGQMGPTVAQEVARVKDPAARAGLLDRAAHGERVTVQDAQRAKAPTTPRAKAPTTPRASGGVRPEAPTHAPDGPRRVAQREEPTAPSLSNNLTARPVTVVADAADAGSAEEVLEKALKESDTLAVLTYGAERGWSCQELLRAIRELRATC